MNQTTLAFRLPSLVPVLLLCACQSKGDPQDLDRSSGLSPSLEESSMTLQYLEFVTPDVDATCHALEELRGVNFGDPIPEFGFARTAELASGGLIGVRAPMRATEAPVVRPYLLVPDIEAALQAAESAGGEVALPATEIPGRGKFAIYLLGGLDHGLWEL